MTQPAGPSAQLDARCYRHPQREALVRCVRCDRPICPDCMRPASVGFQCPDDVRQGARTIRAQRTSVGARLRSSPPYVTITLVVLNVVAYVYTGLKSPGGINNPGASRDPSALFTKWQLVPEFVHDGHDYYELLTSAFLHVSLLHIASNMLALAFVGPAIESVLGRWRFAVSYLLAALGGGAAVYAFGNAFGPTVGASGAIFGLFGVALVLARKIGLDLQWLVGIIALNFIITFSVADISKLGHIGGFVTGLLCGLALGGLPTVRKRVPTGVQIGGLVGVAVLIAVVVVVRTATW
ncbi:rhomboid family intramembrane serine protease [uncultured Jatrophihabitans sp.]|uniref:rhomboid family intramembrane serine protease n=1 Tax=uncultured Jatrophihabitans sp. TaxID=1610747 RepID=UPI0035CC3410